MAPRGGLSRNKVAVPEGAAGSPPTEVCRWAARSSREGPAKHQIPSPISNIFCGPLDQPGRSPPLQGGGRGFKSLRVHH